MTTRASVAAHWGSKAIWPAAFDVNMATFDMQEAALKAENACTLALSLRSHAGVQQVTKFVVAANRPAQPHAFTVSPAGAGSPASMIYQ